MDRRISYLLLLIAAISTVLCASPPSFCKCTCFTNSTIIPLNTPPSSDTPFVAKPPSSTSSSTPLFNLRSTFSLPLPAILGSRSTEGKPKQKERTCNDCNRQFCLDYNLPICKDVKEETDVFATCFQRDSVKDEIVVWVFIAGTVGLLGWALVQPWVGTWVEKARGRHVYNPVGGQ